MLLGWQRLGFDGVRLRPAVPLTVALNCCVCESNKVTAGGVTVTETETVYLRSTGT